MTVDLYGRALGAFPAACCAYAPFRCLQGHQRAQVGFDSFNLQRVECTESIRTQLAAAILFLPSGIAGYIKCAIIPDTNINSTMQKVELVETT